MPEIIWNQHIKSYFVEDTFKEYEQTKDKQSSSLLAALKIWYQFPGQEMIDTGNFIVLYRHDHNLFHPRINMQLRGKNCKLTNQWLDNSDYQIPAPFDNRKKFRLSTITRFSYYEKHKEWFFRYGIPHLLAVMVEKNFGFNITGPRRGSSVFIF